MGGYIAHWVRANAQHRPRVPQLPLPLMRHLRIACQLAETPAEKKTTLQLRKNKKIKNKNVQQFTVNQTSLTCMH
jgi:hypothetical protein